MLAAVLHFASPSLFASHRPMSTWRQLSGDCAPIRSDVPASMATSRFRCCGCLQTQSLVAGLGRFSWLLPSTLNSSSCQSWAPPKVLRSCWCGQHERTAAFLDRKDRHGETPWYDSTYRVGYRRCHCRCEYPEWHREDHSETDRLVVRAAPCSRTLLSLSFFFLLLLLLLPLFFFSWMTMPVFEKAQVVHRSQSGSVESPWWSVGRETVSPTTRQRASQPASQSASQPVSQATSQSPLSPLLLLLLLLFSGVLAVLARVFMVFVFIDFARGTRHNLVVTALPCRIRSCLDVMWHHHAIRQCLFIVLQHRASNDWGNCLKSRFRVLSPDSFSGNSAVRPLTRTLIWFD